MSASAATTVAAGAGRVFGGTGADDAPAGACRAAAGAAGSATPPVEPPPVTGSRDGRIGRAPDAGVAPTAGRGPVPPAASMRRRAPAALAARSASANSAAVWYLSSGRLQSAFITTAAYASGTPSATERGLGGAAETCCMATATSVSPVKGRRPASI